MIETFVSYIQNKDDEYVIFDIGSRDCLQSIEFYKTFPRAKIYAFECNPNTLELCKKNIEPYTERITLIEGAVCDYDGDISFYPIDKDKTVTTWPDGNPGASSLFKSSGKYPIEKYVQYEIKTNCHRLDTVMEKYNIPKVDIIWMDLQGAELLALKGLGTHIDNVRYINTEASYIEIYSGQVMFNELNDYLIKNSFRIKNNVGLSGWFEDVIYEKIQDTFDLTLYNYNKHSQRGHDGILSKIMKELNIQTGFFIEFGAWDGIYLSNCRYLYENGWGGCFIEASTAKYLELSKNYKNKNNIVCVNKFVYPNESEGDTLDKIYKQYLDGIEIDLLSIDIDGRDYEIFEKLELRPKVIIIEGGFSFHPCIREKIPYNIASNNIQQPLYVMCELAKKKNYTPICFNQDTFLLRNDLFDKYSYFQNIKNDFYHLWKSAYYNIFTKEDRIWLNNYRRNMDIIHKYENPYYYVVGLEETLNVFDVVIPVGPNDKDIVENQIKFTKKNILGYRHIYLICYDPNIVIDGCITVDEKIFPFSIETVEQIHGSSERNGWYLQQLLKLYAGTVIPNILERYLVIDTDTFFIKPTRFIDNNICLYNYGYENHTPYFEHINRLNLGLSRVFPDKSGICHHMMFETKYVKEIIDLVEKTYSSEFYKVFLGLVSEKNIKYSGASEYELYFNYMFKYHSDKVRIRKLEWKNHDELLKNSQLDYISVHHYYRSPNLNFDI
jgi:FkbM family methyltransferase